MQGPAALAAGKDSFAGPGNGTADFQPDPGKLLWLGRPAKLVDGTTVTLPDTPENQVDYPQQSIQKPGLGFPIVHGVGLLCGATGAVLDAAIGPYSGKTGSEHAWFRELLGSIAAGDLILAIATTTSGKTLSVIDEAPPAGSG